MRTDGPDGPGRPTRGSRAIGYQPERPPVTDEPTPIVPLALPFDGMPTARRAAHARRRCRRRRLGGRWRGRRPPTCRAPVARSWSSRPGRSSTRRRCRRTSWMPSTGSTWTAGCSRPGTARSPCSPGPASAAATLVNWMTTIASAGAGPRRLGGPSTASTAWSMARRGRRTSRRSRPRSPGHADGLSAAQGRRPSCAAPRRSAGRRRRRRATPIELRRLRQLRVRLSDAGPSSPGIRVHLATAAAARRADRAAGARHAGPARGRPRGRGRGPRPRPGSADRRADPRSGRTARRPRPADPGRTPVRSSSRPGRCGRRPSSRASGLGHPAIGRHLRIHPVTGVAHPACRSPSRCGAGRCRAPAASSSATAAMGGTGYVIESAPAPSRASWPWRLPWDGARATTRRGWPMPRHLARVHRGDPRWRRGPRDDDAVRPRPARLPARRDRCRHAPPRRRRSAPGWRRASDAAGHRHPRHASGGASGGEARRDAALRAVRRGRSAAFDFRPNRGRCCPAHQMGTARMGASTAGRTRAIRAAASGAAPSDDRGRRRAVRRRRVALPDRDRGQSDADRDGAGAAGGADGAGGGLTGRAAGAGRGRPVIRPRAVTMSATATDDDRRRRRASGRRSAPAGRSRRGSPRRPG